MVRNQSDLVEEIQNPTDQESNRPCNWEERMEGLTCEEAWQLPKVKYEKAVEDNVPPKRLNNKYKPQWMKARVKKAITKKHELYQQYSRTKSYRDYEDYKKQNNRTRQAEFERKLMKEFKDKPIGILWLCEEKAKSEIWNFPAGERRGRFIRIRPRSSRDPDQLFSINLYK